MTAIRGVRLTRRRLCGLAGGYAAAAVALAVLLVVLGSRAAERTGLHRQVYPEVGFNGAPLLDDASPEITLDFLDNDPALPRRFFSVRWRGFWYVPEPGEFDLYGAGDDRLDFWLDLRLQLSLGNSVSFMAFQTPSAQSGFHPSKLSEFRGPPLDKVGAS